MCDEVVKKNKRHPLLHAMEHSVLVSVDTSLSFFSFFVVAKLTIYHVTALPNSKCNIAKTFVPKLCSIGYSFGNKYFILTLKGIGGVEGKQEFKIFVIKLQCVKCRLYALKILFICII